MVSPPPSADEAGQGEAEALPMHALAIAPSQAADAQPTANGTVSRWPLEPAAAGPAQAPHPRLQQGCSPRSPNGEAAREPAPAETLVAGGSSPAAVDTALSDALREEKNRETGTGTWNQMVLLRPGRPAGPESPVIRRGPRAQCWDSRPRWRSCSQTSTGRR